MLENGLLVLQLGVLAWVFFRVIHVELLGAAKRREARTDKPS